jgi:hypothetical protein
METTCSSISCRRGSLKQDRAQSDPSPRFPFHLSQFALWLAVRQVFGIGRDFLRREVLSEPLVYGPVGLKALEPD